MLNICARSKSGERSAITSLIAGQSMLWICWKDELMYSENATAARVRDIHRAAFS